jgi:endonuclease YncB( thermonuclease family)
MKSFFAVVALLFFSFVVQEGTEEYKGKVIGITDGDTIKILVDKTQVTIRLEGIDAPDDSKESTHRNRIRTTARNRNKHFPNSSLAKKSSSRKPGSTNTTEFWASF